MKTILSASAATALVAFAAACVATPAEVTESTPSSVTPPSTIEAALRSVDVGKDLASAQTTLERALRDGTVAADARDDVEIALATAYQGQGDQERAVATLEATVARHGRDDWARQHDVSRLLMKWLTGAEPPARRRPDFSALPVAPVAHALAKTIPRLSKDRVEVVMATFGGDETSEMLGTFRLGDALRQEQQEQCPLCDGELSVHSSSHGYNDWTAIPIEAERFSSSLVVFHYDQERGKIPSRYDAYLPLPTAAIEKRLESGKGFYAVKERPGAPAIVLFAAPRTAQLSAVEGAFAVRTDLPKEPVEVNVPHGLLPREIQGSVRASFGALRACYEALPEPRPTGTFELDFAIDGQGHAKNVVAGRGTTIQVPAFTRCMTDAASKVSFAAIGGAADTTVRYPIQFSPD